MTVRGKRKVLPFSLKFFFRVRNNDDQWRILADLFRLTFSRGEWSRFATGIVFDFKDGKAAGEWKEWQPDTGLDDFVDEFETQSLERSP